MALPKLSGSGIASSTAGLIGKSVKTGAKAFGAMALSQMEPQAIGGIVGAKMLVGKLKGKGGDGQGENSQADIANLQESIKEIAPEINQTGIQSLSQQVEQVPPRTSEPIVEKIEELKEAKEAETNLEPVVEKLDELTPMLEKIDTLTEQNETDFFDTNFILDNMDQTLTSIDSMFTMMMRNKEKQKSDKLENDREDSRKIKSKTQSKLSKLAPTEKSSGGIMGMIMSLVSSAGMIPILGVLLTAAGAALTAALPVLIPLVLTAGLGAAVWLFLETELADKLKNWLSGLFFDAEKAMRELLDRSAKFSDALLAQQAADYKALTGIEKGQTTEQIAKRRALEARVGLAATISWQDEMDAGKADEAKGNTPAAGSLRDEYLNPKDGSSKTQTMQKQIEEKLVVELMSIVKNTKDPEEKRSAADLLREYRVKAANRRLVAIETMDIGHRLMDESPSKDNLPPADPDNPMVGFGYNINDEFPGGQNVSDGFITPKWTIGKNEIDMGRVLYAKAQGSLDAIDAALAESGMDTNDLNPAPVTPQQVTPVNPAPVTPRQVTPQAPPAGTNSPIGTGQLQGQSVSNTKNISNNYYTNLPDRDFSQFGGSFMPDMLTA